MDLTSRSLDLDLVGRLEGSGDVDGENDDDGALAVASGAELRGGTPALLGLDGGARGLVSKSRLR